jgi:carbon storage regulator
VLVLSRKAGESIIIAGDIVITVVDIGRGRVQIGIDAPAQVPVYRHEIVARMIAAGELEELDQAAGGRGTAVAR